MAIEFKVMMDAENMQGKAVLVFLRPVSVQHNALIHAWQELTTSAGATASFQYDPVLSANVFSRRHPPHFILSETMVALPGSLLEAVSTGGLSPMLQRAPSGMAMEKLTPQQAGVINNTDPYVELDCQWLVNHKPVVTVPDLGKGMICPFEYEPNLYFMVAMPPLVGQTYLVDDFEHMTCYPIPTTTSGVYVTVTRDQHEQGRWNFSFGEVI